MLTTTLLIASLTASPQSPVETAAAEEVAPLRSNAIHFMPLLVPDDPLVELGYERRVTDRTSVYVGLRAQMRASTEAKLMLGMLRVQPHFYFYGSTFNGLYAAPVLSVGRGALKNDEGAVVGNALLGTTGVTLGISNQFGRVSFRAGLGPAVNYVAIEQQKGYSPITTGLGLTGDLTIGWLF